jgi:RNA polymerase sigma-70 factor (ECF subfamily)
VKARHIAIRELFETAYARGWTPVYRFALAWTNDREEAMDAAQEAFARIWERRDTIDLSADIVPLAITIERRLLTDRWRALRRRMQLNMGSRRTWSASDSDDWADVQAAFSRLTPAERVTITATTVSGLSYAEVGEALGITEGAARAAASRGRRKLAEARHA